jgi:hypothetical protein
MFVRQPNSLKLSIMAGKVKRKVGDDSGSLRLFPTLVPQFYNNFGLIAKNRQSGILMNPASRHPCCLHYSTVGHKWHTPAAVIIISMSLRLLPPLIIFILIIVQTLMKHLIQSSRYFHRLWSNSTKDPKANFYRDYLTRSRYSGNKANF